MNPQNERSRVGGRGSEKAQTIGGGLQRNITASPASLLLPRLEGVQKVGQGWRARCPACGGKSRKLSVSEGDDGRLLLHCFAGCPAVDVVHAVGLELGDLFVRRNLRTMTPAERSAMRQAALIPRWKAAVEVLVHEANIALISANDLAAGRMLDDDDRTRLAVAAMRIFDAQEVLT